MHGIDNSYTLECSIGLFNKITNQVFNYFFLIKGGYQLIIVFGFG
jgi:hypothetical protein